MNLRICSITTSFFSFITLFFRFLSFNFFNSMFRDCPCHFGLDELFFLAIFCLIINHRSSSPSTNEVHLMFSSSLLPNKWSNINTWSSFLQLFNIKTRLCQINFKEPIFIFFIIVTILILLISSFALFFNSFFISLCPVRFLVVNIGKEIANPSVNRWIYSRTTTIVIFEYMKPKVFMLFSISFVSIDNVINNPRDTINPPW